MKKKLRISLVITLIFFFINSNSVANISSNFIDTITDKASNILSSQNTREVKIQELIKIGENSVDIDGIGFYTLGKHRKSLNDDQKDEFKKIFREYFLKSFSSRLSQYSDPKIIVVSQNVINEKYTIVSSILVETNERPEIKIDWRVYTKDPDKPLVRDLIIEGLSLARTQKEEFNSVIQSAEGDVNVLLQNLESFNNKL